MNDFAPPPRPERPTNRHFWFSTASCAPPPAVWSLWADVAGWPEWDAGLRAARLTGVLREGAGGSVTTSDGRELPLTIMRLDKERAFGYRVSMPLGWLNSVRWLSPSDGQTVICHEVWFSGLSALPFSLLLGPAFRRLIPEVVSNVKRIAEANGTVT